MSIWLNELAMLLEFFKLGFGSGLLVTEDDDEDAAGAGGEEVVAI